MESFENRFIWLNGLAIYIDYEYNASLNSHDAIISVQWDKYDIYKDVRWCGNIKLSPNDFDLDEPSLCIKPNKQVLLDRGKSPVRRNDPPNWNIDLPTPFTDATVFEALPQSHIKVQNGAEIRVRNGSLFWMKAGSKLEIEGDGKLIIEQGAHICIDPGAEIILHDAESEIIMEEGSQIGPNPNMNPDHFNIIQNEFNCSLPCAWDLSGDGRVVSAPDQFMALSHPEGREFVSENVQVSAQTLSFGADIVLRNNSTVDYEDCELRLYRDTRILIEPGSKLNLENTVVRKMDECDDWHGIYLSGTSNASQTTNPELFGEVVIQNGAVIQGADGGVNNFGLTASGEVDWNSIGGIIKATDAIFLNNDRAAQFLSYQNTTTTSVPTTDKSFFTRCSFIVDNDHPSSNWNGTQVSMYKTSGIDFNACEFRNDQDYAGPVARGMGIKSINASYATRGQCEEILQYGEVCEEADLMRTLFHGFTDGINAYGDGGGNANITVVECRFEENDRGVYIGCTDKGLITRNLFDLSYIWTVPTGLYIEQTGNADVVNNEFFATGSMRNAKGIVAKDLGAKVLPIRHNRFDNLHICADAQGNNRGESSTDGLEFYCNRFANSEHGLLVSGYPQDLA